jgi:phosphoribosylanthranilate isomerase
MTDPSFLVKICGITNEEDARTAIEAGANALGFNFYPQSPRYISPDQAHRIASAVPGNYLRVGVFVNPSTEQLLSPAQLVPLDVVQLHGDHCPKFVSKALRIWRAIAPTASTDDPSIEAWLLDTPSSGFGGSGRTFDWTLAQARHARILLAGGLDGSNVAAAILTANPWGVDACSRLESSPGKKSAAAVRAFITAAVEAQRERLRAASEACAGSLKARESQTLTAAQPTYTTKAPL